MVGEDIRELIPSPELEGSNLAKILLDTAKRDMFNGVGRILVDDFNMVHDLELSALDIMKILQKYYPNLEMETKGMDMVRIIISKV